MMLFVERGTLAIPETVPGQPIVLMYSGSGTSTPPTRSGNGEKELPSGYAALVDSGRLGLTHNPGFEPAVVLAEFMVSERMEEFASAVDEATPAP